jgi:hypothetical protein
MSIFDPPPDEVPNPYGVEWLFSERNMAILGVIILLAFIWSGQ